MITTKSALEVAMSAEMDEHYYGMMGMLEDTNANTAIKSGSVPRRFLDKVILKGRVADGGAFDGLADLLASGEPFKPDGLLSGTITAKSAKSLLGRRFDVSQRHYHSPIIDQDFLIDQALKIETVRRGDVRLATVALNPNRFVIDPDLQPYEPLIWLLANRILPALSDVVVIRADVNCDYLLPSNKVWLSDKVGRIRTYDTTRYMDLTRLKERGDELKNSHVQLVKYEKSIERKEHTTTDSYLHYEELEAFERGSRKGVTRMELRFSTVRSDNSVSYMLNHPTWNVIDKTKLVAYHYTTKDGRDHQRSLKKYLNLAGRLLPDLLAEQSYVTPEIIENTKAFDLRKAWR